MLFIVYLKISTLTKFKESACNERPRVRDRAIEFVVEYNIPCKAPCEMINEPKATKNEILLIKAVKTSKV